ncbi:MAG: glutaredoxin family protein [Acidimicrobiia bacterium]|nr:glutaredoxin family protein [Acidimicrobiia bacterium]
MRDRPRVALTLYSKPGCHLCDEMKAVIDRVAAQVPLSLDVQDITSSPELEQRYGLQIPVLRMGVHTIARHRVTEGVLLERLTRERG